TKPDSLLHTYVADTWVQNISQGHNGYLEIIVTIGAIGFALAMAAFVVLPAREFWRFDPTNVAVKAGLFAIFVFMVLHNFVESDFLESDDPAWVALCWRPCGNCRRPTCRRRRKR